MPAATSILHPVRVAPRFVERVWGKHDLSPLYPLQRDKIGEVWFHAAGSPLLIKFIYTTDKLSIQVHPGDEYARRHHGGNGKTEMWHILAAEPGAVVGLGLKETVGKERLREACLDGSIVELVDWKRVQPGDTLYAEAGTIHAIGAGVTLCEIQQNSDITYRLYDYGRPRELHLEHGIAVSNPEPCDGRVTLPFRSPFFVTEELRWSGQALYDPASLPDHFLIVLEGGGTWAGEPFTAGEVWQVARASAPMPVLGDARLLRTYRPG